MKRLLVLRALKLGDFLTGLPALRALAAHFPDHERILAAPAGLSELVDHVGVVDSLLPVAGLSPLPSSAAGVDVAVDLHGRGPGSQPLLLALRPGRLIAFEHPDIPGTSGGPRWYPGEHEVHRWCRLLTDSGIPADPTDLSIGGLPPSPFPWAAGATVIHPGASSAARRWPACRFAAVARAEAEAGRAVVITGSAAEARMAEDVARQAGLPDDAVLAGRTGLVGLASLIAGAGRVVCGDTGVAHVATAVGTPSVVLFGPVPPSEWGPPADRPWHVALWAGRRGDPHASRVDPGLYMIGVEEVLGALAGLDRFDRRVQPVRSALAG